MGIKVFTAVALIAGFGLFLALPLSVSQRPSAKAPIAVRRAYAQRLQTHLGLVMVTFVAAGVGSLLVVRQARAEYRVRTQENLRNLVRGRTDDGT